MLLEEYKNKKEIEAEKFMGNTNITEIEIPEGVEKIGAYAFADCDKLEKIILPTTLKEISEGAFAECTKLKVHTRILNGERTSIEKLPDDLEKLGEDSLFGLGFVNLEVPEKVSILKNTFRYNKELESIVLPKELTEITGACFYNCAKLEKITIPSKVNIISSNAFERCKKLKRMDLEMTDEQATKIIKKNINFFKDSPKVKVFAENEINIKKVVKELENENKILHFSEPDYEH